MESIWEEQLLTMKQWKVGINGHKYSQASRSPNWSYTSDSELDPVGEVFWVEVLPELFELVPGDITFNDVVLKETVLESNSLPIASLSEQVQL